MKKPGKGRTRPEDLQLRWEAKEGEASSSPGGKEAKRLSVDTPLTLHLLPIQIRMSKQRKGSQGGKTEPIISPTLGGKMSEEAAGRDTQALKSTDEGSRVEAGRPDGGEGGTRRGGLHHHSEMTPLSSTSHHPRQDCVAQRGGHTRERE